MAHLVVQEGRRAVVRRDGLVVGVLGAGRHKLAFAWPGRRRVDVLDVRQRLLVVAGQEISAADVPGVRVSAAARWRVVDPVAHLDLSADPLDELRTAVQLAVRDWLVSLPLADAIAGRALANAARALADSPALLQLHTVAAAAQTGGQLVLHLGTRPGEG